MVSGISGVDMLNDLGARSNWIAYKKAEQEPQRLTEKEDWKSWRIIFEDYVKSLSPDYEYEMNTSALQSKTVVIPEEAGPGIDRRAKMLYAILMRLLEGVDLARHKLIADRNGYEAWRQLVFVREANTNRFTQLLGIVKGDELKQATI